MSRYLRLATGDAVKVNGTVLPGIMTALSVSGGLEITQESLETSAKTHVIRGYTTASVQVQITVLGRTDAERYRQVKEIQQAFQVEPAGKGAKAMRIVHPHLDARKIRWVLFEKFDSGEDDGSDEVTCTLNFKEIQSYIADLERKEAAEEDAATATDAATGPNGQPTQQQAASKTGPPSAFDQFGKGFDDGTDTGNNGLDYLNRLVRP